MDIRTLLSTEVIQIGNKEVSLLDLFDIKEETVSEDMMKQAAIYAHIGMLKVKYEIKRDRAKQKKDEEYAVLDLAWREKYVVNDWKITEAAIKSEIITTDSYSEAQERLNISEEQFSIFEILTKSLEMRANMLQSVGAFLRMEQGMTGMNTKMYEDQITTLKNKLRNKPS